MLETRPDIRRKVKQHRCTDRGGPCRPENHATSLCLNIKSRQPDLSHFGGKVWLSHTRHDSQEKLSHTDVMR